MSTTTEVTVNMSLTDLEAFIRRVVREAVHEELTDMLRTPNRAILEYWEHEGPDDSAGDEALLREGLAVIEEYGDKPETWMKWEDFEAELDRAEARGELPA